MIKIPTYLIKILKKINLYILLKTFYYKYFRFFKFAKDNLENNLLSLFLDMADDIQFVDIGAFEGGKTDIILNIDFNSKIIAFEAFEKYFLELKKKYENNENIQIFNNAVSEKNEFSLFYFSEDKTHKEAYSLDKSENLNLSKKIQTISVDSFIKNKKVSIIKIDVEGHEIKVLNGMHEILKCCPTLFVEVTQLTYKEVRKFLDHKDYLIFIYEYNFFKKRLKNNWESSNVIKNSEFEKVIYPHDFFDNIKLDFMFNIIAIHKSKIKKVKKIKIFDNYKISSNNLVFGSNM